MRNEENVCQYCMRQRAITTLSLNTLKYSSIFLYISLNILNAFVPNSRLLMRRTYQVVDFTVLTYFTSSLDPVKLSQ